ncbi:hypothetical protein ACHAXR_011072 [Thalassiosira sp. AJA248-18]
MRAQLSSAGCLTLDNLLKFHTIKVISSDKALVARAAKGEASEGGERLKKLITYNEERGEVTRDVPFDWKTNGDGSKLSLYIKNVPLTKEEEVEKKEEGEDKEGEKKEEDGEKESTTEGEKKKKEPFRPRYDVTRDDIKSLFEPYGHVGIVQLRYGRKPQGTAVSAEDERYTNPDNRGYRGGESYPLGVAIVEFESMEGMEKACKDLLIHVDERDKKDVAEEEEAGTKVLEIKGSKLVIEKMRPSRCFRNQNNGKRSRDSEGGDNNNDAEEGGGDKMEFEPITLEWEKGCVIALTGLSATACDRESIRDAVSDILGVSTDVKTSGLYVDYTRGDSTGKLRLKEAKPTEMKELVDKLNDGTIQIANEKVEEAKILEGGEEEQYWKDFNAFLNNRKRQRDEEKMQNNSRKKQRFGGGRGGGGRGRGRGGRGRGNRR